MRVLLRAQRPACGILSGSLDTMISKQLAVPLAPTTMRSLVSVWGAVRNLRCPPEVSPENREALCRKLREERERRLSFMERRGYAREPTRYADFDYWSRRLEDMVCTEVA